MVNDGPGHPILLRPGSYRWSRQSQGANGPTVPQQHPTTVYAQLRSPMSRSFSRSSSGYFSVDSDSVPSSPLMPNISEAQDDQNDEVWFDEPSHQHVQMAAPVEAMGPEMAVARELRRIGDEFNRLYCLGAGAGGNDAPNEHAIIMWMNDLIGRVVQFFLRRR